MFIGIKTEPSEHFERFIKEFTRPNKLSSLLLRSFISRKAYRVDDVVVLQQDSLFDITARYGILTGLASALVGVLGSWAWMVSFGLTLSVICATLISPLIWFLSFKLRLLIIGHRSKIELISKDLILEKVMMHREEYLVTE